MEEVYNLCSDFFLFHIAFVFVVTDAKIATISIFPKIILLSLIKIYVCSPKIAIRYLKISWLKISVVRLKIAGLKIIARVCVYVCAWVRGCAGWLRMPERLEARAGAKEHKHRSDHHRTGTQATTTRAAATRATTESPGAPAHAYSKRNYKNNSK